MREDFNDKQKIDEQEENSMVALSGGKNKKNTKRETVRVEETVNKDGFERKVVRDLGNGVKTVEITHMFNKKPNGN